RQTLFRHSARRAQLLTDDEPDSWRDADILAILVPADRGSLALVVPLEIGYQGHQIPLDGRANIGEWQVVEARFGERVLELDADLVESEDREGHEHRHDRGQPVEIVGKEAEREGEEEDEDELADLDRVGQRERGTEDPLAAAEVIDELR